MSEDRSSSIIHRWVPGDIQGKGSHTKHIHIQRLTGSCVEGEEGRGGQGGGRVDKGRERGEKEKEGQGKGVRCNMSEMFIGDNETRLLETTMIIKYNHSTNNTVPQTSGPTQHPN